MDEDEIDTETLQAQIDLSMSFAQNLVSSWIKSPHKLSNRNRDVETELKEYMRRPPRLGVGAPIPETQSFSREAARLKGHLTGKRTKRSRDDEENVTKGKAESSDEESRAGAIKKKVRLDQSRDGNGKKRGEKQAAPSESTSSTPALPSVPGPTDTEMSELAEVLGMVTETNVTDAQDAATSSLKFLVHNSSAIRSVHENQPPVISNSPNAIDRATHNTHVKAPAMDFPPQSPNLRSLSFHILKHPVLNLDSPSSDDNSDQEAAQEPTTPSPKKRKRRRKKKKHPQTADVTMTTKYNEVV